MTPEGTLLVVSIPAPLLSSTMLLVIFGAGASYDSDPAFPPGGHPSSDESARPPLTRDLFAPRFGHYLRSLPSAIGVIPQLRKAADSVEAEIERIRDDSGDYEHLPRQLAALRCYIREVVRGCDQAWWERSDGITNYAALIQTIERWRQDRSKNVCFVTFNYDTLLDQACRAIVPRFPLQSIGAYVSDARYQVLKLHGSVDWYHRCESPDFPAGDRQPYTATMGRELLTIEPAKAVEFLINSAGRWSFADDYRRVTEQTNQYVPWPYFPAIAIPTATKADSDFECPSSHLDILGDLLPKATHVLVIGWRGIEGHFYQAWRTALSRASQGSRRPERLLTWQIVDNSEENTLAIEGRLRDGLGMAGVPGARRFAEGFSAFLASGELNSFLDVDG